MNSPITVMTKAKQTSGVQLRQHFPNHAFAKVAKRGVKISGVLEDDAAEGRMMLTGLLKLGPCRVGFKKVVQVHPGEYDDGELRQFGGARMHQ